jgi:hypothetical protein
MCCIDQLKAQGINDREPTIHLGPNGQYIEKNVQRPQSKPVTLPKSGKVIDYVMKDAGRTRKEINDGIIDLNLEKAARSGDFETRAWAQFEKEQRLLDRNVDNQIIPEARQQTLAERRLRDDFKQKLDQERAKRDHDLKLRRNWTRQKFAPTFAKILDNQKEQVQELETRQGRWRNRLWSTLDITGTFRKKQELTKTGLLNAHRSARNEFRTEYRDEIEERYKAAQEAAKSKIDTVKDQRRNSLQEFREKNKGALKRQDTLLQTRADQRELASRELEKTIDDWKRMEKQKDKEPKRAQGQDRGRTRQRQRSRGPDYDPS